MSVLTLDERTESGITVRLTWDNAGDVLSLSTLDHGTAEEVILTLDDHSTARDAFNHPGAYGALRCNCCRCSGVAVYATTESDAGDDDDAGDDFSPLALLPRDEEDA